MGNCIGFGTLMKRRKQITKSKTIFSILKHQNSLRRIIKRQLKAPDQPEEAGCDRGGTHLRICRVVR